MGSNRARTRGRPRVDMDEAHSHRGYYRLDLWDTAALRRLVRQANVSRKRREWNKLVKTVLYTGGKDKRIGIQTKQGWMETQDTLYDLKLMEKKIPLAEIYTNAFQP